MKEEHIKRMQEQAAQAFGYESHAAQNYRESWRIFRIMAELIEGYQFLRGLKKEVTVLGSARFKQDNIHYKRARDLGRLLAGGGFTTITGGGPGIMEAANRGAHEDGGISVGLNIELPFEQVLNPYVTKFASFNYFFTRKVMLTSPANAFVLFPGGFGTMDEFFEIVDLMQMKMLHDAPIILVGREYWEPLIDFLHTSCCERGILTDEQIDTWHIVDTAEEAYEYIDEVGDAMYSCDLSPNNFHCVGNIDWKIFRVMAELVEGFEFLTSIDNAVTVLGSKSVPRTSESYAKAEQLAAKLAKNNHMVVTGGRFGIAEAVNKGAFEADGISIGLGMEIAGLADLNTYLTRSLVFKFPFTRKLMVTAPSKAFFFFPGGFGTLHQLFEVLTLIQTRKMPKIPIILFDREFWQPLHELIKNHFVHDVKTISDEDDELYQIVDDVDQAMRVLEESW